MDTFLPIALYFLLGLFAAGYGTMIGAGGGFIIVPVLLLLASFDHTAAVGTSLVVVFFNAASGTLSYWRQQRIDFYTGAFFAVATIPGSIIGAFLTEVFSGQIFNICFGVLLSAIAVYLLLGGRSRIVARAAAKEKLMEGGQLSATNPLIVEGGPLSLKWRINRYLRDKSGEEFQYSYNMWLGLFISFIVGFLSSILGIGGGVIHVPMMISLLDFPAHLATATSHFILVISSFFGAGTHALNGDTVWVAAIPMSIGAVIGAQIGARLSKRFASQSIVAFLAIALLLVGVRLIFS